MLTGLDDKLNARSFDALFSRCHIDTGCSAPSAAGCLGCAQSRSPASQHNAQYDPLSLSRLARTRHSGPQDSIFGALHHTVHRQTSSWISALPRLPQTDAASVQAALIKAVENCAVGWTIVVQPALDLVTELLDGAGKAPSGFSASLLGKAGLVLLVEVLNMRKTVASSIVLP